MHPPDSRTIEPRVRRAVHRGAVPGPTCLALLLLTSCSGGESASLGATTDVEVCVDGETSSTGPAVVEVRQDGEVVGTVELGPGGTAGVRAPPGPVEAYVDGELVGSGDLGEGGSISSSCTTPSPTSAPTSTNDPTPEPAPGPTDGGTGTPLPTGG